MKKNNIILILLVIIAVLVFKPDGVPASIDQLKAAASGVSLGGIPSNPLAVAVPPSGTAPAPVSDPVILAVRPALTGQKIGYFSTDTNKQAYYTVTGIDITKAVKVTGDNSFSVTVRGIWRVKLSPALVPDFEWDASGTKVLKIYTLYDDHCCSSKVLAIP